MLSLKAHALQRQGSERLCAGRVGNPAVVSMGLAMPC